MTDHDKNYDLAIIGGGLSGSLLTIQILERWREHRGRALRIFNCDRDGAFGRGVPYGERHTRPGFLLIETVAKSTPATFQQWLHANHAELVRSARESDDAALRAWAEANDAALAQARFDELYVPRRWFGQFTRERHAQALASAQADGVADVTLVHRECIDVRPRPAEFELAFANATGVRARLVVLAAGNIPRVAVARPGLAEGYLHDLWQQGYDALEELVARGCATLHRPVDLVLVGSGATAGEVVYFLAHQPALLERIRSIRVVSRSGYLAGGGAQLAPPVRQIRADAAARPAAREYVEASRQLALRGLLSSVALDVEPVPRVLDTGRLALEEKSAAGTHALESDLVVNCSGSGDIDATASPLLENMLAPGQPFRANRLNAGFELRPGTYETAHVDGCFVIGPLLNEEAIETHVESIHGVYRAVDRLAPALHARLASVCATEPRAPISTCVHTS